MTHIIIWPEYRTLTNEQLRVFYEDAKANGELDRAFVFDNPDVIDMKAALSDAGHFTFATR